MSTWTGWLLLRASRQPDCCCKGVAVSSWLGCPNSVGIVPLNSFVSRTKLFRPVRLPNSGGIEPRKLLPYRIKLVTLPFVFVDTPYHLESGAPDNQLVVRIQLEPSVGVVESNQGLPFRSRLRV